MPSRSAGPSPAVRRDGLAALVLHRVRLPLLEPFVAAHGTEHERAVTYVEARDDEGHAGWGECVSLSQPTYSTEYADGSWLVLRDRLGPAVLRGDPVEDDAVVATPMAWTALAAAMTDLQLRRTGRSLAASIGGTRTTVATTAVVGQRPTIPETIEAIGRLFGLGHRSFKLKVAPGHDTEILAAVRTAFPTVELAADANGSYPGPGPELDVLLAAAADHGLTYIEQPLPATHLDDLAAMARTVPDGLTIVLDESVPTAAAARRFAEARVPFGLNLKPARVGGLDAALATLAVASDAGWPVFIGGMLETGVGRALALAAASWSACTWPTDLGPSARYFADDVTEPIELMADGRLPVPSGPGIGVTPRPDRLAAVLTDRVELRR